MHIELTEMLRCPEPHPEEFMVLSTGEMSGRMVRYGVVGCPVCRREYEIVDGVVYFGGTGTGTGTGDGGRVESATPSPPSLVSPPEVLQALLDLGGPGGYVILLGTAARRAVSLAALMGGIHFVGINAPPDVEELPVLSLMRAAAVIPLRQGMARGVVVGAELVEPPWLAEAVRVLLRGRRLVVETETVKAPGVSRLASGDGLWVGEKT